MALACCLLMALFATVPAMTIVAAGRHALATSHLVVNTPIINETLNPGDVQNDTGALILSNTGAGNSNWSITTAIPGWLSVSPTSGTLAADSSMNIGLYFTAPDTTVQTLTTSLVISDPNADNASVSVQVNLSIGYYSRTWYFAEGFTGPGFTEYLTLANPNPDPATVTIQYLLQGELPLSATYSILGNARYTINVNQVVGPGIGVAMAVASDLPIIAERPMYFTYTGITGVSVPGGSDTLGATSLGVTFAFAYLDTTANHDTYLTVLNQNSSSILATIKYYPAAGGTSINRLHTVPAQSRYTIKVNSEGLGSGTFSAVVSLSAPGGGAYSVPALGLVERPMYLVDATTGYTGSADVIGVPDGSTSWDFAEGFTSPTFSERYILANPLSTTATRATVTFYRTDGSSAQSTVPLQPGQQVVVDANSILGSGVSNSATVTADQPILAERFMSFTYTGGVGAGGGAQIPGASDVLGAQSSSDLYYFAEGYTGPQFAEYLTVENPNPFATTLTVMFLPQSGAAPTVQTYIVGQTSRFTLFTNQVMPTQSFSMIVQASAPVVAERPMYFAYNGSQTGGTDVVGYAPHLTPVFNQGFCGGCVYATNGSLNAGTLDEGTGLLENVYPFDFALPTPPIVDPTNSSTVYFASYYCEITAWNSGQTILWQDTTNCPGGYFATGSGQVYTSTYPATAPYETVTALNAWSGTQVWSSPLDSSLAANPIDANGLLYATTYDTLYVFNDTSGASSWQFSAPIGCNTASCSPSMLGPVNGVLYYLVNEWMPSGSAQQTVLYALNATSGAVEWTATYPGTIGSGLTLNAAGTSVFVNDGNGNTYAYDASTGALQWTGAYSWIEGIGGGTLVTLNYANSTYELDALDSATGALQWRYVFSGSLNTSVIISNATGSNQVYFGVATYQQSTGGIGPTTIYALNLITGAVTWSTPTPETIGNIPTPYPDPTFAVGYSGVYFETAEGTTAAYVYALNPSTGAILWKTELYVLPAEDPNYPESPATGISITDPVPTPFTTSVLYQHGKPLQGPPQARTGSTRTSRTRRQP